jgi:ubiquinone/menaquinone biosynthesis C-methylase UbiE
MTTGESSTADKVHPLEPRHGYDVVAQHYESWQWFKLWQQNEEPIVHRWLKGLPLGFGLDAGAGTARYTLYGEGLGHRCAALDISFQMLRIGQARAMQQPQQPSILFVEGDVEAIPFRVACFDWSLCSRVLSHIDDPARVFRELAQVLKSGAECLISDVHPDHPYTNVNMSIDGREVVLVTHKHSLRSVVEASTAGRRFDLLDLHEVYFDDLLVKPPREGFAKLYRQPNPAIFYFCRLRRLDGP